MLLFCKVEAYKLKVTLLYGCFSRFLNCTNGAKSAKHHYAKILIDGIRKLLYEKKRLKNVSVIISEYPETISSVMMILTVF